MGNKVWVSFPPLWPGSQSTGFYSEQGLHWHRAVFPSLGGYGKGIELKYSRPSSQWCCAEEDTVQFLELFMCPLPCSRSLGNGCLPLFPTQRSVMKMQNYSSQSFLWIVLPLTCFRCCHHSHASNLAIQNFIKIRPPIILGNTTT